MSAKIIGVIQVKSGVERWTVSTNLAGEGSKQGRTVLIDCDLPQETSASWFAVREQSGKAGNLLAKTETNHRNLVSKVEKYQDPCCILLDGPPSIAKLTQVLASLCFVPVGESRAGIWATNDLLALIEEAKRIKKNHSKNGLDTPPTTRQTGTRTSRASAW